MRTLAVALVVCVACSAVAVAGEAVVIKEHPRLWVLKGDIPRIRERCRGAYKAEFEKIRAGAASYLTGTYQAAGPAWAFVTRELAFLYLATGDRRYSQKVVEIIRAAGEDPVKNQYVTPHYIRCLSCAYDWCYDAFTPQERRDIARVILMLCDYQHTLWRHNDYCNHYVNEWMAPLFAALALRGDGIETERVDALFDKMVDEFLNHVLPAANETAGDDGGQPEGYSYSGWGYAPWVAHMVEAWRTATGQDLWPETHFLRWNAQWMIYGSRPFDGSFVKSEDIHAGKRWDGNEAEYVQLVAARYQDPYAQWIAQQVRDKHHVWTFTDVLWEDPGLKPKAPGDLALARHFDRLGWVMTRSSWEEDATFGFFQCGDERAGHQHRDNNAFTIHRFAPLAIDSGVYEGGSPHYPNYSRRTIAHNTITVYDPEEKFWTGESNDGGQNVFGRSQAVGNAHPDRFGEVTQGSAWDVGDIVAYEANPYFTYAVGDASRSYDRKKLVEFRRAFLHIQPDWFVIYDRVVTTKPNLPVRWLLHSINQPEVTGGTVSIINGEGRLDCRTLWPSQPRIEVIGGPGREFWVDGKNHPPKGKDSEQGAWRIEVTQDGTTRYEFLHALRATSSSVAEMDHVKVSLEESTFTVGFWESGRWVEVVFSRDWSPGDPVSGHITVRAAGTGFVFIDRDLTQKVTPEAGYVRWDEGDDR